MARISTIKEAVMLCGKSGVTPFIWGHRGLGKSSLVQQLAAVNNMGFVDERCSQIEASDLRGLPARENGRTVYSPPASMPRGDMTNDQILEHLLGQFSDFDLAGKTPAEKHTSLLSLIKDNLQAKRIYDKTMTDLQPRFERGILFLDELNRGQDDVLQAGFQLVLDRKVGTYTLPPGWFPVAAGNFNEGYQVNGFTDPAFINRFCHITVSGGESTVEDWVMHMTAVHNQAAAEVIEFTTQDLNRLDGDVSGDLGFTIQPSRRSWDAVVRVLNEFAKGGYSELAKDLVLQGLVGPENAQAFGRYRCPVKPRDLLDRGVKPFEAELSKLQRGQIAGLMWGLISYCKGRSDDGKGRMEDDKVRNVCVDFAAWLATQSKDRDICVAFVRALVSEGGNADEERTRAAVISNPRLASMMAKHFAKNGGKKGFLEAITERPEIHKIIADVAWGN